jgi:uncharacterized iron-regulated membrane protein
MAWLLSGFIIYFFRRKGKPKATKEMSLEERKQHAKEDLKDMLISAALGFIVALVMTLLLSWDN